MGENMSEQTATTTKTNTSPPIRVRDVRVINCITKNEIPCTFETSWDVIKVYYPASFPNVSIWIDYNE